MIYLDSSRLQEAIFITLTDCHVTAEAATHVATSLVTTSLRGVDSHGVNLFPHYVRAVKSGRIKAEPDMKIVQTGPSAVKIDADHAFGHYAGSIAIRQAVKLAKQTGLAAASVSNSTHFGAAAYFALQASREDCIGFACTNADALVKAYGARKAFFGTNPICFTVPLAGEDSFCLDMATSQVSWNKVLTYRRRKEQLPPEWAFDENGYAVEDPEKAVCLNPAGIYKGFGLGVMVDVLCALLSGGPISKDILPMFSSPIDKRRNISHFFMALSVSHFCDPPLFRDLMKSMVDRVRAMEPLREDIPVMVAGDPEKHQVRMRSESGIPVDDDKYQELLATSDRFSDVVIR